MQTIKEQVEVRQRLQQEGDELNARLTKLQNFLASEGAKALDPVQGQLLLAQRNAMATYLQILSLRLGLLGGPVVAKPPQQTAILHPGKN